MNKEQEKDMTDINTQIRMMEKRNNFALAVDLRCNWDIMREQLLQQWALLTENDLDMTGPDASRIALLIEHKYGIASRMIENYLLNFVRTIPLQ